MKFNLMPKIKFLTILFIVQVSSSIKAQDTLYLNTGKTIVGKIKEISPDGILFLRADRASGPTYSVLNADVNFIKYSNGDTDTIRLLFPTKPVVVEPKKTTILKKDSEQITGARNNYQYKGSNLGEKGVLLFLEKYNKGPKDKLLKLHINKVREARQFQHVAGFGSIVFAASALGALIAADYGFDSQTATSMAASGAVFFVAAQITSGIFKASRTKNFKSAIRHYNSLVQP